MTRPPVLTFLGAAGTVTGSRFLLESTGARVLVDCGMYQGFKHLRERNWAPWTVPPDTLDAVVLTHAHLDHSGLVPRLVRDGFRGPVVCTPQTAELAAIVTADSGHLLEEEAAYANERGFSKHHPALPLYTEDDARKAASSFRPVPFGSRNEIAPGMSLVLNPAGHILGSSTALVEVQGPRSAGSGPKVLFSGDLGRSGVAGAAHPILRPPPPPPAADVVVVESTYGNRRHEDAEGAEARLAEVITRTARRGGTVVVPSFAVDRTEVLLLVLRRLMTSGRVPSLPVYADSPMALAVLGVYRRAIAGHDPEVALEPEPGVDPFDTGSLHELRTPEESRSLNTLGYPCVIVSASGMATGGRVLHHLQRCLPDERCAVVLPGFQSEGTRGRLLADGARTVKLLGRYVPVRAEICVIDAYSAHADAEEVTGWLGRAPSPPGTAYVVHGEPAASAALAERVHETLGWQTVVPSWGERVRVD